MDERNIYADQNGKLYIHVGYTAREVYAWFRPVDHIDDGAYDTCLKMSEMTLLPLPEDA